MNPEGTNQYERGLEILNPRKQKSTPKLTRAQRRKLERELKKRKK